jgi:hypothetical protein
MCDARLLVEARWDEIMFIIHNKNKKMRKNLCADG